MGGLSVHHCFEVAWLGVVGITNLFVIVVHETRYTFHGIGVKGAFDTLYTTIINSTTPSTMRV